MSGWIITIIVCFLAGMGAGLGTGFAGMSAAAVITPMLVTFLGMPAMRLWELPLPQMCLPAQFRHIHTAKTKILTLKTDL